MKKIKNLYKSACLLAVMSVLTTSCDDWLTIYPTSRVVEEQFWEDRNDLEAVRYGAYKQMASCVEKMGVWGDLRSDAYNLNASSTKTGTFKTYNEIVTGVPDSSMTIFSWDGFYTCINYCNKILKNGPIVLAKDKQFTSTEWNYIKSEMTALRSLCYFYLIRSFKDVPYTTDVINSDAEVKSFPQTNQLQVLDQIILDCESVKGKARNRFSDNRDTKGLITNTAIYAMLADMYLWRASLREGRYGIDDEDNFNTPNCIINASVNEEDEEGEARVKHTPKLDYKIASLYADEALKSLAKQTKDAQNSQYNSSRNKTINFGHENCDMIKNEFANKTAENLPSFEAQSSIFNSGNSVESIFELQYSTSDNRKNDLVNHLYGSSDEHLLAVSENAMAEVIKYEEKRYDTRYLFSCQSYFSSKSNAGNVTADANYNCLKWESPAPKFEGIGTNAKFKYVHTTGSSYRNWIIYRMSDMMLIKAEALACIGEKTGIDEATYICAALRARSFWNFKADNYTEPSNEKAKSYTISNIKVTPQPATPSKRDDAILMVMNERMIELLGEGKRWYDLVRWAERKEVEAGPAASADGINVNASDYEEQLNGIGLDPRENKPGTLHNGKNVSNGQYGMEKMVAQFMEKAYSQNTFKQRWKNRYGLYCPIYYKEIQASNGALKQNPVWNHSKYQQ